MLSVHVCRVRIYVAADQWKSFDPDTKCFLSLVLQSQGKTPESTVFMPYNAVLLFVCAMCILYRQVTRGKAKSGVVIKHQRKFVDLKTTSNIKGHFKSGFAPLYRSLVTSLLYV